MLPDPVVPSALRFSIDAWSAWAPGLVDAAAWRAWALQPALPAGTERPELAQFPPLLRRRADRLARMALHTASALRTDRRCPMVFASERGETQRAATMLRELASTGLAAPGPFSLSVHNAVAALDSIAHGDTGNYTALAAGVESTENAIVEAVALLADGCDSVIVTLYDETLPECYQPYVNAADAAFAWSWRLSRPQQAAGFELSWGAATATDARDAEQLPHALSVLRYFLSNDATLTHDGPHCRWTWRRLA
jgi:hypothetical protein